MKKTIVCQNCGKSFEKRVRNNDNKRNKYCSRNCYFDHNKAKKVELKCTYCGKNFVRDKWRINTKPMKNYFCSSGCYGKYRSANPHLYKMAPPDITGLKKAYSVKKCPELDKETLEQEYCRNKLRIVDIAEKYDIGYSTVNLRMRRYGIKTDRTRYIKRNSYDAIKKEVKRKRGDKCEICGWDKADCDTHHLVPLSKGGGNEESNLIILCPNCHRLVHCNKLKI